jgi:hypothetical protein
MASRWTFQHKFAGLNPKRGAVIPGVLPIRHFGALACQELLVMDGPVITYSSMILQDIDTNPTAPLVGMSIAPLQSSVAPPVPPILRRPINLSNRAVEISPSPVLAGKARVSPDDYKRTIVENEAQSLFGRSGV